MRTLKGLLNLTKRSARWAVLAIILALIGYGYYVLFISNPYTTDAYVQGNWVKVAARATGPVLKTYVRNNQVVHKGQLLFEIDPTTYVLEAQRAEGQLEALSQGGMHASEGEKKAMKAALALAKERLSFTKVLAPADGTLSNFFVRAGDYVKQGEVLFSIVENNEWWIQANYLEYELRRIPLQKNADVIVSMYPSHVFKGVVTGIGSAISRGRDISTQNMLPEIKESISWLRLFSRFPVFIKIINTDQKHPLRIGATAAVTIHVR